MNSVVAPSSSSSSSSTCSPPSRWSSCFAFADASRKSTRFLTPLSSLRRRRHLRHQQHHQHRRRPLLKAEGASDDDSESPTFDEGYNCIIREDGVIVSEDIPSGLYEVSAWWGGGRNKNSEEPKAPRCDTEKQRGCQVKCEVVEDGCLVCEGLAEGTYKVHSIGLKELNEECEVSWDGETISCDQTETEADVLDTGDIEMKERADDHSVRLGG